MTASTSGLRDALQASLDMARALPDGVGMVGYGVAHLLDGDGQTKQLVPFANLITNAGDEYYARRAAAGVGAPTSAIAQPTLANGMKLGTGTAAAATADKVADNAALALGAYITGSNVLFSATTSHPTVASAGTGLGWNVTYSCNWAAGVANNGAITEVVIVNDAATNATSTKPNTYARAVISAVNKTASDSLTIAWAHTFRGTAV